MKKKYLILFLFIGVFTANGISQGIDIRTSAGFGGYGNPMDGFYYSFDIGFKVLNGVQVAPTFTSSFIVRHSSVIKYRWSSWVGSTTKNFSKGKNGELSNNYDLFVIFNPFKWTKNTKYNDIDFGIGVGLGFQTFSSYSYSFIDEEMSGIVHIAGTKFNKSARIFYNYHYDKYFIGVVFGGCESNSILGFQFGVSIE